MDEKQWIKPKMTVSLNRENLSKLEAFTSGLPKEAGVDSISKLVLFLLETPKENIVIDVDTEKLLLRVDKLEADNHALGHQLSDEMAKVSQLEPKLAGIGKPVNKSSKPVETASKPQGKQPTGQGKQVTEKKETEETKEETGFKNWWE